jgi:hypothetical protein
MKSEVEHWDVPTEEAAVKSVGALKKGHRDWHLAAGATWRAKGADPRRLWIRRGNWLPP